ncbi:hypothetical protein [Peribacillus frigoritolerans]|uniref:hypothetical protein n=1 Tax=Peribacillus castrilensis TaxID=2897690 RepID=UPI003DA4496B
MSKGDPAGGKQRRTARGKRVPYVPISVHILYILKKMQAIVCLQSEPIIQLIGFYFSNEG